VLPDPISGAEAERLVGTSMSQASYTSRPSLLLLDLEASLAKPTLPTFRSPRAGGFPGLAAGQASALRFQALHAFRGLHLHRAVLVR